MEDPPASLFWESSAIILGVLGLCGFAWSVIATFVDFGDPNPMVEALRHDALYLSYLGVSTIIGVPMTIFLIVASIASLKLRPWARKGMIVYAWYTIIQCVIGGIFSFVYVYPKMFSAMPAAGPAARRYGEIGGLIGGGCGVILTLVFPICILYFFSRPRVVDAFNGIFPAAPTNFPVDLIPPASGQEPPSQFP